MTLGNELGLKVGRFDEFCRSAELRGVKKMETIWRNQPLVSVELTNHQVISSFPLDTRDPLECDCKQSCIPACNTPHAG